MGKSYFLCTSDVVNQYPNEKKSKPFKSGWNFDVKSDYYVALLDFDEVFEAKIGKLLLEHKCYECTPGQMNISNITIANIKRDGLFYEIENKLHITTLWNQAMVISNLATKYMCDPIEFINKSAAKFKPISPNEVAALFSVGDTL